MSSDKALGFALVGLGMVGPAHAKALSEMDEAVLRVVCDMDEGRARAAGERFGCEWSTDLAEILKRPDIDVVDVTTPQFTHCALGSQAARAGKHVIVEKPMERNCAKARELIEVCDKAGVTLGVIFQSRFKKSHLFLKKAISEGKLGRLFMGGASVKWYRTQEYYDSCAWRGTWDKEGGGVLINQAIHTIDRLLDVMGPVESLQAYYTTTPIHNIEVEDEAVACLRFKNGAIGTIAASTAAKPGLPERLEINGELGTVVIEGGIVKTWEVEGMDGEEIKRTTAEPVGMSSSDPMAFPIIWHKQELQNFCHAIIEGHQPLVTGRDGIIPLEVISAIYESSRNGRPVIF